MIVNKAACFRSFQSNENGQKNELKDASDERIKKLIIDYKSLDPSQRSGKIEELKREASKEYSKAWKCILKESAVAVASFAASFAGIHALVGAVVKQHIRQYRIYSDFFIRLAIGAPTVFAVGGALLVAGALLYLIKTKVKDPIAAERHLYEGNGYVLNEAARYGKLDLLAPSKHELLAVQATPESSDAPKIDEKAEEVAPNQEIKERAIFIGASLLFVLVCVTASLLLYHGLLEGLTYLVQMHLYNPYVYWDWVYKVDMSFGMRLCSDLIAFEGIIVGGAALFAVKKVAEKLFQTAQINWKKTGPYFTAKATELSNSICCCFRRCIQGTSNLLKHSLPQS